MASHDNISLWHPATSTKQKIAEWQGFLVKHKVKQPQRQAFREHYLLTEKEQNELGSLRFANHFLTTSTLTAVANNARWQFKYVHEGYSFPRIFLPHLKISAQLVCDYDSSSSTVLTKEVSFVNRDNTKTIYNDDFTTNRVPLSTVPPIIYSEICRQVDLFVSVASVKSISDSEAQQQEFVAQANGIYREIFELGGTAAVRKSILEMIGPDVGLRNLNFDGNWLLINGKVNNYRIHLKTALVQNAETLRGLQININLTKSLKATFSPVADDEILYVIIAKALVLQEDSGIAKLNN